MTKTVIEVNNLGKQYRLGAVGTGTMSDDLKRLLYKIRGKEDPFLKIGEVNDRTKQGNSDYVWALKDINFKVKQGEVLGIIGKNGAGKSTLLKILSRTTLPSIGEYKIKGRVASLLEVGTGFHPDLSGRENIYLNGAIMGMTKAEIKLKFDEIVDFSGVERYIDTPVKRYSSGMYVRLAFAVAAHLEPEILIIDEVLAVGDAEFQKKCLGKMKAVSGEGRTVLFVSHNMLATKSLCTTGIWLDNGTIQEVGQIENVIDTYLSKTNQLIQSFVSIEVEEKEFIIHSISILDNNINGNFNITEDLVIFIKTSSNKFFEAINVNLFFNTIEGNLIFATCSDSEYYSTGITTYKCIIPANTLNDSIYNLNIMVVSNGEEIIHDMKEVISIEGIEQKREGSWMGKYPGLIRPQYYKWSKILINE